MPGLRKPEFKSKLCILPSALKL